jgi:hypothetical protein
MAKTKANPVITLEFPRTGNPWIDAGIVGLYRVLRGRPSYVQDAPGADEPLPGASDFPNVAIELQHDCQTVRGPFAEVQGCLERAYDRVIACYFDLSSKKQREDTRNYNFYYDPATQTFEKFPKKRAAGAALLLFDKAVRPAGDQEKWGPDPATGKRTPGRLPPSLAHLQGTFDRFLADNNLKPGPPAGLLIGAGNEVRPKIKIQVNAKKGSALCFLTGRPEPGLGEAKNTAFPLFGGSRSFMSGTHENLRIGWQLDFVGKFVPAIAFFCLQGDDLHLFFPESPSLVRVNEMADLLGPIVELEPNLFRNFEFHLGGYFQRRSEVAAAFLHRVFEKLSEQLKSRAIQAAEATEEGEGESLSETAPPPTPTVGGATAPETEISAEAVYNATGAVGFTIVSAFKKGNVWMARDFWSFHDLVYLARLFEKMQEKQQRRDGRVVLRCRPRSFLHALIDFEAKKDKTVLRDRVCEAILQKRGVLPLLERHAFHVNKSSDRGKSRLVKPLLDFAVLYEVERHKGTDMGNDYEMMVDTATRLGTRIGHAVAKAVLKPEGGDQKESRGRARGALFRLRKTRTTADFVGELAHLQFRYGIDVPKEVLDGKTFSHDSFEEFRGFCVVAALNRFQYETRPQPASQPASPK